MLAANTANTTPCISPNPIDVLLHIDPLYHAVTYWGIAVTAISRIPCVPMMCAVYAVDALCLVSDVAGEGVIRSMGLDHASSGYGSTGIRVYGMIYIKC